MTPRSSPSWPYAIHLAGEDYDVAETLFPGCPAIFGPDTFERLLQAIERHDVDTCPVALAELHLEIMRQRRAQAGATMRAA